MPHLQHPPLPSFTPTTLSLSGVPPFAIGATGWIPARFWLHFSSQVSSLAVVRYGSLLLSLLSLCGVPPLAIGATGWIPDRFWLHFLISSF